MEGWQKLGSGVDRERPDVANQPLASGKQGLERNMLDRHVIDFLSKSSAYVDAIGSINSWIGRLTDRAVPELINAREVLDRFHAVMRSKDEARLDP
ncbi:MAG TPA: hypothetical protein VMQ93_04245 [Novosphingobium sp.]|nr:hypothetical protein [Novosphingobium sp.]